MAEEFKVLLGAELKSGELDAIKSQINNLQTNPIKLKIDTQNVQSQINGIKKQIQSLSNIKITLNGGSGGNAGGIQRTVAEVNRAYSDLMNLQKRISSIRIQMGGLDGTKNTRQITELSGQLNRLMADYNNLYQTFNRSFSTDQLDNLNRAFETTNNKITALDAKMADTSAIKSQEAAYKELLAVSKQISNIELKIGGLKSIGGHSNEVAELESQLQLLQSTYQNLATSFQGQLSPTQLTNLGNIIYDTRDKLAQLDAKVADTKAKLASDIQVKVNTGSFDKQLTTLETNFNKLSTSGKSVITDIDAVRQALSNMKSAVASGDMQGLITSYQQYQTALKSTTNQVDIMIQKERELANSEKLASAKTALSSQMDVWLRENSAAASQFGTQIDQLKVRLQSCDATSFGSIKAEFQEITRQAELAGKATLTFGDRLKNQLSKLGTYFSATMMITQTIRGLRSMYDNVVDVDTAMTGLYRVTDLSANQYSALYDQMISSAKEYGATLSDIITSTADWVRLGFNAGDAERLSEITAMYQHVTDLDNATAVENLVTAYKGYQDQLMNMFNGDSTKAIEYVADIFDKLGNEYAVTAADVGSALTKCASAMEVAGNSIQETSAMATGITEVTQNADKAGSALKILSVRLRGTEAKDLEELGEDTDGLISNTGKLRDTIQDLSNVDIMTDNGDFKSTYEIMDGIYEEWKEMRDTDKASLLETIAGKNRASEVAALLNNWEQVRSAMQAATDAEGTASAENEKYMQSLKGHLDTLTAAWQALSNSFLSSDFLSGALEGLTSFLSGLDAVINKVGVLPTLIGGITAALSVKNVGIFKTIEDEASASGLRITNIFSQAFAALKTNSTFSFGTEFNAQLQNDIACINNFKAAVASGTPPVEALKNCLLTASQSAVEYATSMEASSLSTDEFATKQKMAAVAAKAQSKSLVTAKALIKEYNQGCQSSGLAQTDFLKAVGQSNSGLAKYLSGLNGAKGSLAGYVTSLVGAKAASIALQAATMALNVAITMGISMAISGLISMISKWVNAEKEARDAALETGNAAKDSASNIIELYNAYSSANAAYESNTGSKESLEAATDSLLSALGIEESQIQKLKEEYGGLDEAINQVTMDSLKDKLSELTSGYEAAIDELKDKTKDGILKDFGTINFSKQNGAYKEDAYVKALEKAGFKTSDNFSYFGGYQGTTIDIGDTSTLEGIMKAYEKLKDMRTALEEGIGDDYSREELAQNDLYKSINGKIGNFKDEYKNVLDYVDKINDVAAQLQYMDIVKTDGVPQSKEQFDALKQSMVDAAKENQNFVGSQDQINDAITNTLSDIPELSQFFNDVGDSAENATKATKEQLESLKSTFQSNDISDWFDSLSDDDKQLIYEISVKSDDTTLWTLSKWKQELSDMSAAGKTSEESLQSFYDVMNNTEDGNFSDKVNDYLDKVQSLKDALTKIDTGELTDTEKVSLALDFPELAGHTGDIDSLRAAIASLIDTSNQGINDEIDSQIKALGGDGTAAASALESLREMLNAIGNTSGWNFDIDAEIEKFNNLYDAMKESVSGTGLSTEGIKNVEAMFSGLKGYDPSVLFERTEHGIHLNTTALRALQSQYESTTKLGIQERLQDLKQEYNDSAKAVEGLTKGTEAYNKALSDKGLRSTDDILADIENVQTLAAQYEGLTSAYNKWVMAQSAGEEGDMYDNITGSLEDIKKLYDDGLVGTNAFRSAVQMMTNEDLSTANIDKLISVYESGYPTMQRYFQDSSDGCINFLKDVESLNSEWAHMNSDGSWDINFGIGNDEEIAKAISDMTGLQMSTEEVQILMRKLSDYGFDIKLDSAYTSVDELKSKIEETEGKLKELGQEPVDIDVNATDAEAELEKAKGKIQEINDSDASVEVKTAQLDDAYAKIDVLVAKVNQPAFMTIDASQVDSELQGSLGTLQEYQNAVNNLNALQIKGADTSEIEAAKGKVDELAGKIKDLPAETKTKIGLEADDSVEDIKSKISSGDVKIPVSADTSQAETEISSIDGQDVKVNVTTSGNEAIDNLKSAIDGIKDKNVTITATAVGKDSIEGLKTATTNLTNKNVTATATPVGKDGVDALKKSIDSLYDRTVTSTAKVVGTNLVVALKTAIDNLYNKTVSVGANVFGTAAVHSLKSAIDSLYSKTVTATTVTKKVAGVDGTAHANGTAFAQGDWGTKENGVALGGELGQELVVRNGKFFTIGDKSAEFFKYQKGDIIFNAAQTKEIFEKGKITHGTGRGKALAEGTAFSRGSGRFTSGGKTKRTTSGGGGNSSSKSGSGSSGGKSGGSSSSSSSKNDKENFDWIAVAIDRLERAISRLDLKASSVYKSWGTRNSALKSQISEISKEIDLQSKGYDRYIKQANSVGLSASWAKKVRDGKVDIDTVKDENLKDKIKEYQEWYEKALDCKDAIEELKEKQAELYKTAFDNVATKYEGILGVIDHEKSMLDEYINQSEAKGYITSANYYKAQISAEKKNIKELQNEKANLLTALQNGVNSGTIKQGSEAWYEMVNQIDDVTLSIEQANTTVLELNKSIREVDWQVFDLLQERISYITTEADFLINLMENDRLYDDKGQLTNEGKSTMGLHGVNYNVYMAQADKYAQEIAKIDKDLAKDPYNQDLAQRRQELLELQQEMILAAEDEKEAIRDMVKEGIELELDALQELIDKYTDALDRQKDLYDYQKKVAEQTKEIASIEKQMSAYEGDDSEETKAKIQKLKVSLEDAKSDLEDTQYDKYISDQKQLLDDLYNEYETILNQRLDNLDALITDMIGQINTNAGTISTTLSEKAESVGYTLSDSMTTIWDTNSTKITTVLTTYGQNIQNGISTAATTVNSAIGTINTNLNTMIGQLNTLANTKAQAAASSSAANSSQSKPSTSTTTKPSTTPSKPSKPKTGSGNGKAEVGDKVKYNSGIYYEDSYGGGRHGSHNRGGSVYITKIHSGSPYPYHISTGKKLGSGDLGWLKLSQISGYATGVKNLPNSELAWTQEGNKEEYIIRKSDGAILTPIAKKGSVLNHEASGNIWNMANNPSDFIRDNLDLGATQNVPNNGSSQNVYNQNLENVVFNFPNIKNYEQLLREMQKDKNFEKLILSMTIDRVAGKSSLSKRNAIR
nr:MAG TPA: minor tail protein [Caudoviricetes sp.]